MGDIWVVNASPLITLAKAGHLTLLTATAVEVLLPDAVVAEILGGPDTDPARQAVEAGWGTRVTLDHIPISVLEWGLGAGESAVLALTLTRTDCTAVLDDAKGRMCARTLGVPVIGTLGVVLRAKRLSLIPSATQVVRELRAAGLYLDDSTVRSALKRVADEDWDP